MTMSYLVLTGHSVPVICTNDPRASNIKWANFVIFQKWLLHDFASHLNLSYVFNRFLVNLNSSPLRISHATGRLQVYRTAFYNIYRLFTSILHQMRFVIPRGISVMHYVEYCDALTFEKLQNNIIFCIPVSDYTELCIP